jgi:hypothetical protein
MTAPLGSITVPRKEALCVCPLAEKGIVSNRDRMRGFKSDFKMVSLQNLGLKYEISDGRLFSPSIITKRSRM